MNNLNTNTSNKSKQIKTREPQMTTNKNQTEIMASLPKIRTAYTDLIDYLKTLLHQKKILTNPSYAELSKKLGFTYNFTKDRKDKLKHHYPQKKTFDDLYNRLSKRYETNLQQEWPIIENKFIILYKIAFPSNPKLPSMIRNQRLSIKRKFFNDLKEILRQYFPKARIFDTDLSRIFFRRPRALKDSHLKGNYEYRRLELSTLFGFIYKIRIITSEKFIEKVRDIKKITPRQITEIKSRMEEYIENFIFSNPYKVKYINDTYDIGAQYFKTEYHLTLDIWIELSKAKKTALLLKQARRILQYSSFGRLNRFGIEGYGTVYSWDSLIEMMKHLVKLVSPEEFNEIAQKIKQYTIIRNLHPIKPRIYHRSWYSESTVKFHIIILILRDLGLEILNLQPIKPVAFKKTDIMEIDTYERHHIFPNDKLSIDINRLVLTMHKNHAKLERKTNLILQLIQSRIDLTLNCPYYYKIRFSNWKTKWQQYLKRRSDIIEFGIEYFIREYFTDKDGHNYIIERFFRKTPNGKIESEITMMLINWIKKKRPVPNLNPIILKRLLKGTQELTPRGYSTT